MRARPTGLVAPAVSAPRIASVGVTTSYGNLRQRTISNRTSNSGQPGTAILPPDPLPGNIDVTLRPAFSNKLARAQNKDAPTKITALCNGSLAPSKRVPRTT